ncbi:MAG: carboxypeptidase-like regulatory domain-containing protein, partial [Rhodothermaceae bacterium]
MNNIFRKRNLIFCFLLFLVAISAIEARGKLKGKVIGKSSGEPLIGVNVMIVGTQWGAATDIDGKFSIIGIRPGTYSVKASYIGYRSVTIQQVVIRTGLTAELNFELDEDGVQTEEVVVVAEQKLVQRDLTSTRKTVTRESMGHIPGFESSDDIFRLQGGITMAAPPQNMQMADGTQLQVRDESVKDVHVRGGRGGEILFMVDGVPVNHPVYGGRSVLDLNIVAVEQVELLTGAFSARYGQAQSGVINITTRSGGEKFKGGAEYKTDKLGFLGDDRNTQYGSVFLSGPEPITNYLLPALGINTKGKMNFFLSANSTLTDTEHNNNRTRKEFEMFGFKLTEQQDNKANINAKLNWSVTDRIRATFGFNGSWKQWSGFDWNWLFHPDNKVTDKRNNVNFNFLLNHVLSEKTYYSISMGYLGIDYTRSLDGKTPADFWVFKDGKIESTVREPYKNSLTYFNAGDGYETYWRDDKTSSFTLNADFTSQITDDHLFEVGLDRCVLGQDILLSQCLSPPRCINGSQFHHFRVVTLR